MEKNAYVHFVDERDFKEVSVVGKRKSKKNRAVGRKVRARTTKSKATAAVKSGARALSLMKTVMKVPKKVAAALKNSQKTKKRLKRQLQAIVSQRLNLPRTQPRREE